MGSLQAKISARNLYSVSFFKQTHHHALRVAFAVLSIGWKCLETSIGENFGHYYFESFGL